jgi:hypothetical protein
MRDQIMIDWFKKGENAKNNNNTFEAFIYLWISWVIGCRIFISYNIHIDERSNNTDREDILLWSEMNSNFVVQTIEANYSSLEFLGKRRGARYGDPIIDANHKLTGYFSKLSMYLKNTYTYKKDDELANHFGELLNKVRNNLFHGDKSYNDKNDLELIQAVLPTLYDFAKESIKYSQSL